jgi:all-trans-8'-apo-beta-carotenal 15,15'-oxygenase
MVLQSPPVLSADQKAWASAIAEPATEFAPTLLPVLAGQLPPGLRGTLYRNGPARLERGDQRVAHWFDGDGAILAVHFEGHQASATYRYVHSAGYLAEAEADQLLYRGYGTLPGRSWRQRLASQLKNVANTSVLCLPDRLLALWEAGLPHALALDTLETLGPDKLGQLSSQEPYSAHPKRHPRTGDIFNFGLVAGANATLNLYRSSSDGQIQAKQSLDLNGIPLIHDFALVDRYLVFCVPPVRLNPLPAVLALSSFSDALMWQPRRGTQILVIDADSFEVVAWNQVDPWYQWHFGSSSLSADGDILLDVVAYPSFATNDNLKQVAAGVVQTAAPSQLWQLRLDPATGTLRDRQVRLDMSCEFPVVGSGSAAGATFLNLHRPGLAAAETAGELFGAIARLEADGQLTIADAGDSCYPSEPIYVPDSDPTAAGWLVSVVYCGDRRCSEVWIYDSRLEQPPVCRLSLPQVVPPSFHGAWRAA